MWWHKAINEEVEAENFIALLPSIIIWSHIPKDMKLKKKSHTDKTCLPSTSVIPEEKLEAMKKQLIIIDSCSEATIVKILIMILDNQQFPLWRMMVSLNSWCISKPRYLVPSCWYFSDTMNLPNLRETKSLAFDIWTWSTSKEAVILHYGPWVKRDFLHVDVVLHATYFSSSHTGANTAVMFHSMWAKWKIDKMQLLTWV